MHPSSPLINFRAEFDQVSFIVDKDDSEEKGYQHACKRFHSALPDIKIDTLKPEYDLWNFGLYIHSLLLPKSVSCNLIDLFPQKINNEENRPFWFTFKRPPIFHDRVFCNKNSRNSNLRTEIFKINGTVYADLSYGALITMSRFFVHKDYLFCKRNRWTIYIRDESFEIQTISQKSSDDRWTSKAVKYKIPLDIINRAAIFHLQNDGFDLFINMKGNVHKLSRESTMNPASIRSDTLFKREGIHDNISMSLFSTIRIRLRIKNDPSIIEHLEREGKICNNTSDEMNRLVQTNRDQSLQTLREIFGSFLHFFYKNRIHVCFGSISPRNASSEQLSTIACEVFPTFIQSYSWAMLCNIGFRVQIQIYLSKEFIKKLHKYSKLQDEEINDLDVDDRFYRLCLYLHRRSLEYFFLDLDTEIQIGIDEYKDKFIRFKKRNFKLPRFYEVSSSVAYIPSVVLTPTTRIIRPLKLCKLNRVIREERFGSVRNFALVELRDEAQRLLFPSEYRALKKQILDYLTHGFYLTPTRLYKYLHHSQSQVKCKQFWFYHHDEKNKYLSHQDAYTWMGNFDKERIVAKHAARIALCFTSTDKTIQVRNIIIIIVLSSSDIIEEEK